MYKPLLHWAKLNTAKLLSIHAAYETHLTLQALHVHMRLFYSETFYRGRKNSLLWARLEQYLKTRLHKSSIVKPVLEI